MKFKLKYGLCSLVMVALLAVTTSCQDSEKHLSDLEYAYTPSGMSISYSSTLDSYYAANSKLPILAGGSLTLTALMTPYNVTFPEIIFTSSNEEILTVEYSEEDATVQGTDGVTKDCVVTAVGTVGQSATITVSPPRNVSDNTVAIKTITIVIVDSY